MSLFFFCMCVCCVCMHIHICMGTHECACVWRLEAEIRNLLHCTPLVHRDTNEPRACLLHLIYLLRLLQGSLVSAFPALELQEDHFTHQTATCVLGISTPGLTFVRQAL